MRLVLPIIVTIAAVIIAVGVALSIGPGRHSGPPADARLQVVVTTGMIADLVRLVGGEHVAVIQLVASGVDPHLYAPTRGDILHLESADVILHNGLHLEGRLGEAIERAGRGARSVHAVAELVVDGGYTPLHADGAIDPHLWMDVAAWAQATAVVRDILAEALPEHDAQIRAASDETVETLMRLDAAARSAIASIPPAQRLLITAHDAFGYFGRAYGVEVHGIQGISTESEAGVRRISELTDLLVQRGVPAVFVESTVADRSVRALVEAAAARGHTLRLGGELFSDAMGPEGTERGTYLGMIDHNVTTIVGALGGVVPAAGLRAADRSGPSLEADDQVSADSAP